MKLLHSTRGFGLVTNHYSGNELVLLSRKVFSWYGGRGGGGGGGGGGGKGGEEHERTQGSQTVN